MGKRRSLHEVSEYADFLIQEQRTWEKVLAAGDPDRVPEAQIHLAVVCANNLFKRRQTRPLLEQAIASGHPDWSPAAGHPEHAAAATAELAELLKDKTSKPL